MSKPIVDYARKIAAEPLYGNIDYFVEKCKERGQSLILLANHIEEQDAKMQDLEIQVKRLLDKILTDKE